MMSLQCDGLLVGKNASNGVKLNHAKVNGFEEDWKKKEIGGNLQIYGQVQQYPALLLTYIDWFICGTKISEW